MVLKGAKLPVSAEIQGNGTLKSKIIWYLFIIQLP